MQRKVLNPAESQSRIMCHPGFFLITNKLKFLSAYYTIPKAGHHASLPIIKAT